MDLNLLLDPISALIVVAGTCVLAACRNGARATVNAWQHARALTRKPFNMSEQRALLAKRVARMRSDGVIRSEPVEIDDLEIADATAALVRHRTTDALVAEHERHAGERKRKRDAAINAFEEAGELAPVMGLAGTLLALSQLPMTELGSQNALMTSVSQAVLSTFYGLLLAHLVCLPLAAAVARRGAWEEEQRDQLVRWLVQQLAPACPSRLAKIDREAA